MNSVIFDQSEEPFSSRGADRFICSSINQPESDGLTLRDAYKPIEANDCPLVIPTIAQVFAIAISWIVWGTRFIWPLLKKRRALFHERRGKLWPSPHFFLPAIIERIGIPQCNLCGVARWNPKRVLKKLKLQNMRQTYNFQALEHYGAANSQVYELWSRHRLRSCWKTHYSAKE